MTEREPIAQTSRWVVKIGSGVIVREGVRLDRPTFARLVEELAGLDRDGHTVTVVSSGAVALGCQRLGVERESSIVLPRLQALAALGQSALIQAYDQEFAAFDRDVAQILLGRSDLDRRVGYLNARNALEEIHGLGAIPVINENDSVATEELRFGDNDQLAAMVCGLIQADLLILLSDVDGIYEVVDEEAEGEARFGDRISHVSSEDPLLDEVAGPSAGSVGTGGMVSKVGAARTAARFGVSTIVARGKSPGVLRKIARGEDVGTWIEPAASEAVHGRKVWLTAGAMPVGRLVCDAGAVSALRHGGGSLLPSGILKVDGEFGEGAVVELCDGEGTRFALGVAAYASSAIERIKGRQSSEIEEVLGYRVLDAVVHRDEMVVDDGNAI